MRPVRAVAAKPRLREEMGEKGVKKLRWEAKGTFGPTDGTDYLSHRRRIFVVRRKRAV